MRGSKIHPVEIWAQLVLCEKDRDLISDFLISEFKVPRRSVVNQMHLSVYHSRRPMPGVFTVVEHACVIVPSSDTRFMVLAPGGENPRPELDPARQRVGIRIHKQSTARDKILEYRNRLVKFETKKVLGSRAPSSARRNAFGPRNFQPHMSLLRPGSGINRDLTTLGSRFRATFSELTFDKFLVDVVLMNRCHSA
jgi:hypothetical protein